MPSDSSTDHDTAGIACRKIDAKIAGRFGEGDKQRSGPKTRESPIKVPRGDPGLRFRLLELCALLPELTYERERLGTVMAALQRYMTRACFYLVRFPFSEGICGSIP